jgi:uncharacterized membrane protein
MGWWMLFGGLLWLAFWAFLVYAVISLVTDRRRPAVTEAETVQPPPRQESPMDIARRRYAAGEISRDELLAIVETLSRPPADTNGPSGLGRAS